MNVYDFDNTIYDGESTIDFFRFLLKKDFKLLKYYPSIINVLIMYKLNIISIEKLTKKIDKIMMPLFKNNNYDLVTLREEFWNKNIGKLKPQFLNQLKKGDVIITGCPNFLIEYIQDKLKVQNIICTQFDLETKKINFLCFGKNKIIAYQKFYKNKKIDKLYTDSFSDKPLMAYASEVYFVRKNKIKLINKEKN